MCIKIDQKSCASIGVCKVALKCSQKVSILGVSDLVFLISAV